MAQRRKKVKKEETLVDIVEVGGKAQNFFQDYQNLIIGVLTGLVVLVGGFFAYVQFIKGPKEKEAMEQMFQAQYQFGRDSFTLALTNPGGGYEGFLDIIENYKGTKAANLANYYSGVAYLNLGQVDAAISYLKDFRPSGKVTPIMKHGVMGDAYSEKGDFDAAESAYKKAVSSSDNEILSAHYLFKLGMLYEHVGKLEQSVKAYKEIKEKYPNTTEGKDIEKYIGRIEQNG